MSDKFLSTGGSGNANISNGTINAYVAGLTVANLKASMPIKTNSINTLVSTKLDITDINNLESRLNDVSGITNPYVGDFKATDFETDDYFSVNDELQKIDNFTASVGTDTNITGIVKVPEVATGRVYDSTQATWIELDGTTIDINANDLRLNTSSVITELGGKNLDTTLTTTQTVFNNDQDLITKKVVSDLTGRNSGKNDVDSVAIGPGSNITNQGVLSIAIGRNAGNSNQGVRCVSVGVDAGRSTQGEDSIAIGTGSGKGVQGIQSVAIGADAGRLRQGNSSVGVGYNTAETDQGNFAVAIGRVAGRTNQGDNCVAIGYGAGQTNQADNSIIINGNGNILDNTITGSTRIAPLRDIVGGKTMSYDPISKEISYDDTLDTSSVITEAGGKNLDTTLTTTQTIFNNDQELITKKVVSDLTGRNSGKNDVSNGIAIGSNAGLFTQGNRAIAIGNNAGQSNQTSEAIAIGIGAGEANQGNRAISIGRNAGGVSQGDNCIAIGYASGYTNQASNSVVINGSGNLLDNTITNSTKLSPLRDIVGGKTMSYNPTTKEVSYNNVGNYVEASATGTTTIDSTSYINIQAMSATPTAGNYKVDFSCWFENDEKKEDDGLEIGLFVDNIAIEHSKRRQWTGEAGKYETSIHTQAIITVNGSQQIRAKAKRLGNDRIRIRQRSMVVLCVGLPI